MSDAAPVSAALKDDVVQHYERSLQRFGPTARGMDWKDEASQRLRFGVLCEGLELQGRSLAEVGCGAGHLLDFLRERGIEADYTGYDLSPAMIDAARERHPQARFECRDWLEGPLPRHDLVLCSGLFHVKLDHPEAEWRAFVHAMLHRMWQASGQALAFNLMTNHVDFRSPDLFYSDPGDTIDFCRRELSRFVAVRHDYPLYEYTTHVYRVSPER